MAEILINHSDKREADELVTQFLGNLTSNEQKEFLAFMKGFQLAKDFTNQTTKEQGKQMSIFDLDHNLPKII